MRDTLLCVPEVKYTPTILPVYSGFLWMKDSLLCVPEVKYTNNSASIFQVSSG
jgi:hypothetical protein